MRNGAEETRTPDIQLAKLALYQLSYRPDGDEFSAARSRTAMQRHPLCNPSGGFPLHCARWARIGPLSGGCQRHTQGLT